MSRTHTHVAVKRSTHRAIKRIAARNRWNLDVTADEAVKALEAAQEKKKVPEPQTK